MANDDYDPGSPYDPPPRRSRRRRDLNDYDDAWAAASEDADSYDDLAPGDLAAGYVDDDPRRFSDYRDSETDDDQPISWSDLPPRPRGRSRYTRPPRRARYNRPDMYRRSPTYYRDQMKRGEYGEYHADPYTGKRKISPYGSSSGPHIPFWQILIIVILALCALLAVALACVTILLI